MQGARWITRGASSFDRDFLDVRSLVIGHAHEEHRDYTILEKDYQSAGGDLDALHKARRNPGSEALHGYLMYRAGRPNPTDLIGAMWIIEGLGQKMASEWAKRIQESLGSSKVTTTFMSYHGENDERHLDKLYALLDRVCTDESVSQGIVMTARVVARLYAMQLEEIDNDTTP